MRESRKYIVYIVYYFAQLGTHSGISINFNL